VIEAGAALVVAADPARFASAYPEVAVESVYGPFLGNISNDGERPSAPGVRQWREESPSRIEPSSRRAVLEIAP